MTFLKLVRYATITAALIAISALGMGNAISQTIADSNGCKVWNTNPKANESISWSGQCKDGWATGSGTLLWFLNGKPNGTEIGNFHQGRLSGKGILISANGQRYEGELEEGKRQGWGILTGTNGITYEGQWSNNDLAFGWVTWPDGTSYKGDLVRGRSHGTGIITKPNGEQIQGQFSDGKLTRGTVIAKATSTNPEDTNNARTHQSGDSMAQAVDSLAPRDIVTGQRSLNFESESEEIQRATSQSAQILSQNKARGVGVDADTAMTQKLRRMMERLAKVTHRPTLPWELHLIESKDINAATIGGGKVFFWRGLFGGLINPNDDNEIAAVMAHEMAHVNLRHVGKNQGMQIGRWLLSRNAPNRDTLYRASFTTLQEDDADKLGLLYMALAGFDPRAASRIWGRAHQRHGSNPGDYTYDHSLNIDRLRKVASLTSIAMQYYKGPGIINPDFARLRTDNQLMPQVASGSSDNGFFAVLEALGGIAIDNLAAKREEQNRRAGQNAPIR